MATGSKIKLGGLYVGGTLKPRPTRPWSAGSEIYGGSGIGNIPTFAAGQTIAFGDTPSADENKIQWIEINEEGKKYLVSDRVLLVNVSWDDLNALGFIKGTNITIDGGLYKVRSLTGGSAKRTTDNYSGGSPTNNEWDRWIVNESNISGLPIPTIVDLDANSLSSTDLNSPHNQFWNWFGVYSWTQEVYSGSSAVRAFRGCYSARYWDSGTSSDRSASVGFRPVLEVLNSAPVVSGLTSSFGNKSATFSFSFSATDGDGDKFSAITKVNDTIIDTINDVTSLTQREVTINQDIWNNLALNTTHKITVTTTDSKGATADYVSTFVKVNAAPTASIVEPKGDAVNIPIVDKINPIVVWNFKDTDIADVQSAYQVIVEDLNGNIVHDSTKKTGTQSYYQIPINLEWTKTYKWKVTVWDRYDVASNASEYGFFKPNRAPNLTGITPGSIDKANPIKVGANPIYTWTFEDLDVEAQAGYQLQIYQTSDDAIVYNTSRISRNVQTHTVPDNVLSPGIEYYAILTVWDPNNLSAKSDKLYIATNATPTAPTLTRPIDNFRTSIAPTLSAVIGTDPENDKQHFKVQLSQDKDFATNVIEFSSLADRAGWKVDGFDIPADGVDNSSGGKSVEIKLQVNLEKNKTYYWRMAAIDANTKSIGKYSTVRKIRVGNRIEYNTLKREISTNDIAARRILVALDYMLAKDGANPSTIKVYVTNNALDVEPTWEDATAEFLKQDYYAFVNTTKTAATFAIGVKVVIEANDSMEAISLNAAGITFD